MYACRRELLADSISACACASVSDFDGLPSWPLRGPDERADVPPDEVASLGVADGPYEAVVGILHRSSCTRRRELLQGMPAVGGRQFSQLHRADKVSQRRYHLAPRADRFSERLARPYARQSSTACRTV